MKSLKPWQELYSWAESWSLNTIDGNWQTSCLSSSLSRSSWLQSCTSWRKDFSLSFKYRPKCEQRIWCINHKRREMHQLLAFLVKLLIMKIYRPIWQVKIYTAYGKGMRCVPVDWPNYENLCYHCVAVRNYFYTITLFALNYNDSYIYDNGIIKSRIKINFVKLDLLWQQSCKRSELWIKSLHFRV